jgi:hypothetical protein
MRCSPVQLQRQLRQPFPVLRQSWQLELVPAPEILSAKGAQSINQAHLNETTRLQEIYKLVEGSFESRQGLESGYLIGVELGDR